jgi:hypothetical protein
VDMSPPDSPFHFFDKHTIPTQTLGVSHGVRLVPGGSTIRRGAHVARGVVCMPPMYVNVGAGGVAQVGPTGSGLQCSAGTPVGVPAEHWRPDPVGPT